MKDLLRPSATRPANAELLNKQVGGAPLTDEKGSSRCP
jgi:hypothetical protein